MTKKEKELKHNIIMRLTNNSGTKIINKCRTMNKTKEMGEWIENIIYAAYCMGQSDVAEEKVKGRFICPYCGKRHDDWYVGEYQSGLCAGCYIRDLEIDLSKKE